MRKRVTDDGSGDTVFRVPSVGAGTACAGDSQLAVPCCIAFGAGWICGLSNVLQ